MYPVTLIEDQGIMKAFQLLTYLGYGLKQILPYM